MKQGLVNVARENCGALKYELVVVIRDRYTLSGSFAITDLPTRHHPTELMAAII